MKGRTLLVVLLLTVSLPGGSAFAQDAQSGAISGSVKDPSGAVINAATITVTNDATKRIERR